MSHDCASDVESSRQSFKELDTKPVACCSCVLLTHDSFSAVAAVLVSLKNDAIVPWLRLSLILALMKKFWFRRICAVTLKWKALLTNTFWKRNLFSNIPETDEALRYKASLLERCSCVCRKETSRGSHVHPQHFEWAPEMKKTSYLQLSTTFPILRKSSRKKTDWIINWKKLKRQSERKRLLNLNVTAFMKRNCGHQHSCCISSLIKILGLVLFWKQLFV